VGRIRVGADTADGIAWARIVRSLRFGRVHALHLSATRAQVHAVPLDPSEISHQLVELRVEHRDLDSAIAKLVNDPSYDELQLKRLKVRKLRLKDMIAYLESKLIPDLDA
jgi:hypothetical protein